MPEPPSPPEAPGVPAAEAAASPWRKSMAAFRANLIPGLALQAFALALAIAYFNYPLAHEAMEVLADLKSRLGLRYSMVASMIFGGLIPFLYLRLSPATRARTPWSHGAFYMLFWAWRGIEVDLFYTLQAHTFGEGASLAVVLPKVLVDQILYTPVWAAPTAVILFHWKESGFARSALNPPGWPALWRHALPPALISTWGIWLPAVVIIYCLPSSLQIPLFNFVTCFYALIFAALTKK